MKKILIVVTTITAIFAIFFTFCAYVGAKVAWELDRYGMIDDAWR